MMADVDARAVGRSYAVAALVAVAAAFLLGGYELVRSPANTLFKAAYGKEALPWVMAGVPVGIVAVLWVYGRLLTRVGPRRTLLATSLGAAVLLAGAYGGVRAGWAWATVVLFVLKEAYVVLIVEQYWSLLNSTLGERMAKKVNGPICGVASIGAIAGAMLVGGLAESVGSVALVLLAAAATVPAAVLSDWAYRVSRNQRDKPREAMRGGTALGLAEFRRYPILASILGIVVATQVVSTALDLNFQGVLSDAIPQADRQTAYSGRFFAGLNVAALVMQFVVTPLLLRYVPVAAVHVLLPVVVAGACGAAMGWPTLAVAGAALVVFKAQDYSIFRAAKEVLYIPLSFDARYRAKELIDVLGYRGTKGAAALAVTFAQAGGVVMTAGAYAGVAIAACAGWGACAVGVGRVLQREKPPAADEAAGER